MGEGQNNGSGVSEHRELVSMPSTVHDESIMVGGVEMPFREFLKSRGLSRVF